MEKNLNGKRILVSGGGGGSAAYWCKYLAEQGAHVLVNDVGYVQDESMGGDYNINLRTHESADNVVKAIRDAGGIAEADYEDVSEMNGAAHAVEHCLDVFGGVDILLNATCVSRLNECIDLTAEEWDIVISLSRLQSLQAGAAPYDKATVGAAALYHLCCDPQLLGFGQLCRCLRRCLQPDALHRQ